MKGMLERKVWAIHRRHGQARGGIQKQVFFCSTRNEELNLSERRDSWRPLIWLPVSLTYSTGEISEKVWWCWRLGYWDDLEEGILKEKIFMILWAWGQKENEDLSRYSINSKGKNVFIVRKCWTKAGLKGSWENFIFACPYSISKHCRWLIFWVDCWLPNNDMGTYY